MSGSGSNLREAEVPEEEIDEDYEDEKTEEESGMGSMVAGGAGLVLLIIAGVVLTIFCCSGKADSDTPAPIAPTETATLANGDVPVDGALTAVEGSEEPAKDGRSASAKEVSASRSKSGTALKDNVVASPAASRRYVSATGEHSRDAGKKIAKPSVALGVFGFLMISVSAFFFWSGNKYYDLSGALVGGQKWLSPRNIMLAAGSICVVAGTGLACRKAPAEVAKED